MPTGEPTIQGDSLTPFLFDLNWAGCSRIAQAFLSGPNGSERQFSANAANGVLPKEMAIAAKMNFNFALIQMSPAGHCRQSFGLRLQPQRYQAPDRVSPGHGFVARCCDPSINGGKFGGVPPLADLNPFSCRGRTALFLWYQTCLRHKPWYHKS
jgi:hypothetical protein